MNTEIFTLKYRFLFLFNYQVKLVEKCLQKLLRALHKDRSHTLAHYRHVLLSQKHNIEGTTAEKAFTLSRLVDIDKAVTQTMIMLQRFPELAKKLSQLMQDYVQALRSKEDLSKGVFSLTIDDEEHILEDYKTEILANIAEKHKKPSLNLDTTLNSARNEDSLSTFSYPIKNSENTKMMNEEATSPEYDRAKLLENGDQLKHDA